MYGYEKLSIDEPHYQLFAENGEHAALITIHNLDADVIAGVISFHNYEGMHVVEHAYPAHGSMRMTQYHELLDFHGDDASVVEKYMSELVEEQKRSDDATGMTWNLETGSEEVMEDDSLQDVLDTVIESDRLEPDFEVPDDEPVAKIEVGSEARDIIQEANDYRVGAPVDIETHRGTTYLIGLTEDYARDIADAIHELQMEYRDDGLYESAETADRVEGTVLYADTEPAAEIA